MSESMFERVKRRLIREDEKTPGEVPDYDVLARGAMEEMAEPTEAVLDVVGGDRLVAREIWRLMMREALR